MSANAFSASDLCTAMLGAQPGVPLVVTVRSSFAFSAGGCAAWQDPGTNTLTPWVLNATQVVVIGACPGRNAPLCFLDAAGLGRHFIVEGGATLALYNLVLLNGATFGTYNRSAGFLVVWHNWELASGGAVGLHHLGQPGTGAVGLFVNVHFVNNSAVPPYFPGIPDQCWGFGGAAIVSYYASADFVNCTFSGSLASYKARGRACCR